MIFKIAAISLCGVLSALLLKQYKPELVPVSGLAAGALVVFLIADDLSALTASFSSLLEESGAGADCTSVLLKILGCVLVTQFSANGARDRGETALAGCIEFAGNVLIVSLSLPLFRALVQMLAGMVRGDPYFE